MSPSLHAPDDAGAPDRWRSPVPLAIALSFTAGATDAFAFLQLGGIFTANMTGNVVLAGLTTRPGYPRVLLGATVAVVAFSAALYAGFRATPADRPAPAARLRAVLGVSVAAQLAVAAVWFLLGHPLTLAAQVLVIALSSVAMATQTVIGRRVETASGVATTFVTGTLTSLMKDLADGSTRQAGVRVSTVVLLAVGALCGSLAMRADPSWGAVLPVLAAALSLVLLVSGRAGTAQGEKSSTSPAEV